MTNYAKGAAFERTVKAYLDELGYVSVRAAGSHGAADILAVAHDRSGPLFVSCKIGGKMSLREKVELFKAAFDGGGIPLKASRPKRGEIRFERLVEDTTRANPLIWEAWRF